MQALNGPANQPFVYYQQPATQLNGLQWTPTIATSGSSITVAQPTNSTSYNATKALDTS